METLGTTRRTLNTVRAALLCGRTLNWLIRYHSVHLFKSIKVEKVTALMT